MMEYHFESEIIFDPESEFKSLYPWSISEVGDVKHRLATNQIPWDWSFNFVSDSVTVARTIGTGHVWKSDPEPELHRPLQFEEVIVANLKPFDGWDGPNSVQFSMLGTNRKIAKFTLRINPLNSETEPETLGVMGAVSYTHEIDFRSRTEADFIEVFASLRPAHFVALLEAITTEGFNLLHLRMGGVAGFYSDWSPEIHTERVKVLTRGNEHKVVNEQMGSVEIPRLGSVSEWSIRLERQSISPSAKIQEDYLDEDSRKLLPRAVPLLFESLLLPNQSGL